VLGNAIQLQYWAPIPPLLKLHKLQGTWKYGIPMLGCLILLDQSTGENPANPVWSPSCPILNTTLERVHQPLKRVVLIPGEVWITIVLEDTEDSTGNLVPVDFTGKVVIGVLLILAVWFYNISTTIKCSEYVDWTRMQVDLSVDFVHVKFRVPWLIVCTTLLNLLELLYILIQKVCHSLQHK